MHSTFWWALNLLNQKKREEKEKERRKENDKKKEKNKIRRERWVVMARGGKLDKSTISAKELGVIIVS